MGRTELQGKYNEFSFTHAEFMVHLFNQVIGSLLP